MLARGRNADGVVLGFGGGFLGGWGGNVGWTMIWVGSRGELYFVEGRDEAVAWCM